MRSHQQDASSLSLEHPAIVSDGVVVLSRLGVLGRIGSMEVRLSRGHEELHAAQRLRYRVFCEELGAHAGSASDKVDADGFDEACDHLIVLDNGLPGPESERIVGTYRLLRQDQAVFSGGFYSQGEFELEQLAARHPELKFLELGRSCVLPNYRNKRTIELLWQGIWSYLQLHRVDVMVGCASFQGTVPASHAAALAYLHHHCRAEGDWSVAALASRRQSMDLAPPEGINIRAALSALPPLIKGYLRLGAKVGDGCVIDHDFKTVDVFIILPVKDIGERYLNYYSNGAQKLVA